MILLATKRKGPKSTSKKAKGIIRSEIRTYYGPKEYGGGVSVLNMQKDAHAATAHKKHMSDWARGKALVDEGSFACYYDDQRKMLRKIYGKSVDDWSGDKVHNTYGNLIGREYSQMLQERKKPKSKRRGRK